MTIAGMRAKLDARLQSTTLGFAEPVEFKAPGSATWTELNVHVKTRVRAKYSEEDGTMVEVEELEVLIFRSDIADIGGYECRRAIGRGSDRNRLFKNGHEIESDKVSRYRAIFAREHRRTQGVHD